MTTNAAATSPPPAENGAGGASLNGREARNLAEKHRRDKLNASIQELATMVPHVAESTRRLDKTAVLRFAAHGLRIQHVFGKSAARKRQRRTTASDTAEQMWQLRLTDMLMHIVDSFLITLTCHGQIVLISASVEKLLGHCQSDLYGQNILQITHPEDHALMRQQLIPRDMESLFRGGGGGVRVDEEDAGSDYNSHGHSHAHSQSRRQHLHSTADDEEMLEPDDNEDEVLDAMEMEVAADSDDTSEGGQQHSYRNRRSPSPHTRSHLDDIDQRLRSDRRCFTVRLARAGGGSTRSTESSSTGPAAAAGRSYECVKIDGYFRRSDCSTSAGNFPIVSQLIRRSRASSGSAGVGELSLQHDAIAQAALHGISGNDIVLVAVGRIIRAPGVILNNVCESHQLEYKTRHLIDGRIVDCDPRISLVAGYMQNEVCNLSPFSFMHQDDVKWVICSLRQMYDLNENYGESCFRLLTRNGHFIYLQSKGTIEINHESNEVISFTCLNVLLDEETGRRKVLEMKKKFEMMINSTVASNSLQDAPASTNPQQLEKIVFYLLENLHSRHEQHHSAPDSADELSWNHAASRRYAKTPPLSLVPPAADSVKVSLSKSIKVVNVTAAINLQHNQRASLMSSDSYHGGSEASLSPVSSFDQGELTATETITSPLRIGDINATHLQLRPSVLQMSTSSISAREQLQALTASPSNFHAPPAIVSPPHHRALSQFAKKQKFSTVLKTLFSAASSTVITEEDNTEELEPDASPSKRFRSQDAEAGCYSPTSSSFASPSSCTSSSSPSAHSSTSVEAAVNFHHTLAATLENVDQSLHAIGANVHNLVQQHARLPAAVTVSRRIIDQRLDAIKAEHLQEQQILSNIKSELSAGVPVVVQQQQLQQNATNSSPNQPQHSHPPSSRSSAIIIAPSSSASLSTLPIAGLNASALLAKLPESTTLIRRGKPL